jgi:hypothetical protein
VGDGNCATALFAENNKIDSAITLALFASWYVMSDSLAKHGRGID